MNEYDVEEELTGAETVRQWFGSWPSFHDAEIISLFLARKGRWFGRARLQSCRKYRKIIAALAAWGEVSKPTN
jgi:hypothetical protein